MTALLIGFAVLGWILAFVFAAAFIGAHARVQELAKRCTDLATELSVIFDRSIKNNQAQAEVMKMIADRVVFAMPTSTEPLVRH